DTGYKYDANIHWTSIEDIVPEAGDIKYVWELSRFSFLYSIIRYDYHFQEDSSEWVFDKILDWIAQNPINKGPNYKCSQEIGLRVLNWTFALFFYKNTSSLTEAKFQTILHHINWQMQHVFDNVFFSLKTVRNNHAITETLSLYLVGLLYPFLPHASIWKAKGKQWLETEIAYQIYEDGTHLLFSTNYQRTVLQLLTWFLYLSNANQEQLSDTTYQRVFAALHLLYQCQDATTGKLPNYGPNDGSLFCKLNDAPFRDFRPQLNAAYYFFTQKMLYQGAEELQEEGLWYAQNLQPLPTLQKWSLQHASTAAFQNGGYYIMRDRDSLSFLRCGSHKDRPSHADNLHLDIWYKGKNILRDAGTYKYNTSSELVKYFNGTLAHNTVQLGGYDQMEKGPRFIWLNWSQAIGAELSESEKKMYFRGRIQAFQHLKQPV
ncbi:MAG: heparinase II/III family protein, partial [Bacteroidota bacterium]